MRLKNVFDLIFSQENLYLAYEDATRGRRYRPDVMEYTADVWENLTDLREMIYSGNYDIDRYNIFYIYEPKKRMIMSISFEHRIVQWAIYRVVNLVLVKGYIKDTYGCIPGRGALKAMQRLREWVKTVSRKPDNWFYLKLDISKYFYRISHKILKKILKKKIKDKRLLEILYSIIDCKNTPFGLPPGKPPDEVPMCERLYEVGMPIGNLLSQMFANLYLDQLDQFCKRTIRIKYYIRYMDDIIILCDSKKKLHEWKERIRCFLEEKLELQLNNKTCIRPINQGIEFVGFRIWKEKVVLRKSTTLRIKRSLKCVRKRYSRYDISFREATDTFESYLGMLKHTDSTALVKKLHEDMVLTH